MCPPHMLAAVENRSLLVASRRNPQLSHYFAPIGETRGKFELRTQCGMGHVTKLTCVRQRLQPEANCQSLPPIRLTDAFCFLSTLNLCFHDPSTFFLFQSHPLKSHFYLCLPSFLSFHGWLTGAIIVLKGKGKESMCCWQPTLPPKAWPKWSSYRCPPKETLAFNVKFKRRRSSSFCLMGHISIAKPI